MSTLVGSITFALIIYYLWAMRRPAEERPALVQGPGAVLIPLAILFLAWVVGR